MNKMKIFFSGLFFCFSILMLTTSSCKTSERESFTLQTPSDLQIDLSVLDSSIGSVRLQAVAKNTNNYAVNIEGPNEFQTYEIRKDGVFNFNLNSRGTYTFTIRALALEDIYIEETRVINFLVPDPLIEYDKGYKSPKSYDGYRLVWEDDFIGEVLDGSSWTFQKGTGSEYGLYGWGNNELQYYRTENTRLENGYLKITAKKENFHDQSYTSSRLYTIGKKSFQYGRFDIRAKLPTTQGMWPALWMLGENIGSIGWPRCGEIDIMEVVGKQPRHLLGTLHWHNEDRNQKVQAGGEIYLNTEKAGFDQEFHVFSIEWDSKEIRWYLDNRQYASVNISQGHMSEFHKPFHFLFNIAVGGNWPGSPDQNTIFPSEMAVDYIRVFQQQ